MDFRDVIAVFMLIVAILNFIANNLINRTEWDQKKKNTYLIAIYLFILVLMYFTSAHLVDTYSPKISISGEDQTQAILDFSRILPPIFRYTDIQIDQMDSLNGWEVDPKDGASGIFGLAEEDRRKSIQINYSLGANTSYILSKRRGFSVFGEAINKVNEIGLCYIANGSTNSIELEFTDQDGKRFGKTWREVTGEETWTYLEAKLSDFKCSNCEDENETIDLSKVVVYSVAISEKTGKEGGEGIVTIDWIIGRYPN